MTVQNVLTTLLVCIGTLFGLLAALGLVRMPDLYTRMQSATKAGTLGVACVALAAAVHMGTASAITQALLVILFLFATAPIASHLIARAAHRGGVPLWSRTIRNDLERFDDTRSRPDAESTPEPEPDS